MKAKIPGWATNENHAAGGDPWSGQPCKVEPAAGVKATGFIPTQRPPAEHMNWLLYHITQLTNWIAAAQLKNWHLADVTDFDVVGGYWIGGFPSAICYGPTRGFSAVDKSGYTAHSFTNGAKWVTEHGTVFSTPRDEIGAGPLTLYASDIAEDDGGDRICVLTGGTSYLLISVLNVSTWVQQTAPVTHPCSIHHDWDALWACVGSTGSIFTSTTGLTGSWTTYAVSGIAGNLFRIRHSHDTNNPCWMAISDAREIVYSIDGVTWNLVTPGFSYDIVDLAYDARDQRWILVLDDNDGRIAYSNNNGVSWTQVVDVCEYLIPDGYTGIASDGQGGWIISNNDRIFANRDGGITEYERTFLSFSELPETRIVFGSDCFVGIGAELPIRSLVLP